jgi:uncharacterized membrane protein
MSIESTIEIAAPRQAVWTVLSDVERWPEWTPTMTSVEILDGLPLAVGNHVRIRQPRLPVVVWTVTTLETQRYFEWENAALGVKAVAGHRIEAVNPIHTRVTLTFAWTGWLAPLVRLLYGKLGRRYVQTEAESLKRRCEQPAREPPSAAASTRVRAST